MEIRGGKSLQSAMATSSATGLFVVDALSHAYRDGKLQCVIGLDSLDAGIDQACKKAGLEVVGRYEVNGIKQVVVRTSKPTQLEALAARADVRSIAPEPKAMVQAGSVDNQADISINADDARADFGVDGTGVRIGVLSDTINTGIGGTIVGGILTGSSPQTTGDMPASVRVIDDGPSSGIDEGAGMMELIHDLSPGADLSFASAFSSYAAFASNITALRTDPGFECDVIVDDVIYFVEPVYQNGPIAIAANEAYANGVPYFSSAGNNANLAHEEEYVDLNPGTDNTLNIPNGVDLHDFGAAKGLGSDPYLNITLNGGGSVSLYLQWDEPHNGTFAAGAGAESDLDLYALRNASPPNSPNNIITRSINNQGTVGSPAGYPFEQIPGITNTGGSQATFYVAVDHYQGREPVQLYVVAYFSGTGGFISDGALAGDRTIYGHAAAENASAVAAMFYGEIDTGGTLDSPTNQLDVEPFSSLGGTLPFPIDDAGNRVVGPIPTVDKPQLTAPDGTNTTFFGNDITYDADTFPNFFGTSAAAPHAAAVAALLLEADSSLTPAEVYNTLETTAIDAEATGYDYLAGHGLVDAWNAVGAIAQSPTATPTSPPTSTPTITPTPTAIPTNTATPTATATPVPTLTPTPEPTSTPTTIPTALVALVPDTIVLHHPPAGAAVAACTTELDITIANASDLGLFDLVLNYAGTGLTVVDAGDVALGHFLGSTGNNVTVSGPVIYPLTDTLTFGAEATTALPGPDGNGTLATVIGTTEFVPQVTIIPVTFLQVDLETIGDVPYGSALDGASVTVCYFADIDCDDNVDVVDIQKVAGKWNVPASDPEFDPTADVDKDGDVDVVDIQLVAGQWNTAAPFSP